MLLLWRDFSQWSESQGHFEMRCSNNHKQIVRISYGSRLLEKNIQKWSYEMMTIDWKNNRFNQTSTVLHCMKKGFAFCKKIGTSIHIWCSRIGGYVTSIQKMRIGPVIHPIQMSLAISGIQSEWMSRTASYLATLAQSCEQLQTGLKTQAAQVPSTKSGSFGRDWLERWETIGLRGGAVMYQKLFPTRTWQVSS